MFFLFRFYLANIDEALVMVGDDFIKTLRFDDKPECGLTVMKDENLYDDKSVLGFWSEGRIFGIMSSSVILALPI